MLQTDCQARHQRPIGKQPHVTTVHTRRPLGFTITDGQGGVISLDPAAPNLEAFAEACRFLSNGPRATGAKVLVVPLDADVYVLSYCTGSRGAPEIQIAHLYDPRSRLCLSLDLAETVAAMVDEVVQIRSGEGDVP